MKMDGWNLLLVGIGLLFAVELWQAYAERRNRIHPHELALRRASQPFGWASLLLLAMATFGARRIGDGLIGLLPYPADNGWQAAVVGVLIFYALTTFIAGLRGS